MAPQPRQPRIKPSDYEPASWRLLNSGRRRGPDNMAIDEAILEAVAAGGSAADAPLLWLGAGLPLARLCSGSRPRRF